MDYRFKKSVISLEEIIDGFDRNDRLIVINGDKNLILSFIGELLIKAPFSGKDCLHFQVRAFYEKDDVRYHIGTLISRNKLYTRIKNYLVEVDHLEFDCPPALQLEIKGEIPEEVIKSFNRAGWSIEKRHGMKVVVEEWCISPYKKYLVNIAKYTSAIPPEEEGGRPEYITSYRFIIRKEMK